MRDKSLDNRLTTKEELILIRIGHHLWRSRRRKEWPETTILPALQAIWDTKSILRVNLHKEWLESRKNRIKNMNRNFNRDK